MSVDAVASDTAGPTYRVAPRPVYEGQPYYTFDEVVEQFSFWDLLDIINPLQHIPIIGSIYREITGDEIKSYAQVAGSALYGGGIGALAGIATMVVTESTGKEPAQLVLAAFTGDHSTPDTDAGVVGDAENLASTAGPLGHDLLGGTGGAAQALAAGPGTAAATALAGQTAPGTPALGGATAAGSVPPGLAMSSTPLGAFLFASEAGQMAAEQAAARGLRETAPVLDGARSAALSAMIAQTNTGGLRPETTARPGSAATLTAMLDGTPRDAIAATTPASTDQQSQDMPQNSSQDPGREQTAHAGVAAPRPQSSGQTGGRAEAAMPTDIERGRAALRERLSAVQGAAEPATDRPTGLTLADYRANPNRRAEGGGQDTSRRPRAAVNSLSAADLGRLLPDQATMAGLLERGERAAMAADSRARRLADDAARTATAPEPMTTAAPSFRALPIAEANGSERGADAPASASGPVVSQPWFSQRVMDAMQRYDAQRQTDTGAAS
ncbi:hypothetical protein [uncultured Rhodospira sp.]|uniref:hypothetical protein n=1 Tax=uncultured Rhodospira sp. TaxID=1936189 RepID=UPI00261AD75A|nr:hypothetical protein [uncultured Rhodospira sp.]